MTENTTPTLLEAARALAMAREAYRYMLDAIPGDTFSARVLGEEKAAAYRDVQKAEAALDAAYKAEEYGDES